MITAVPVKTNMRLLGSLVIGFLFFASLFIFLQRLVQTPWFSRLPWFSRIRNSTPLGGQTGEGAPLEVPTGNSEEADVTIMKDIAYGTNKKQILDYCIPKSATTALRPGIILIHGGGGDKSAYAAACKRLAGHGYMAAAINFREEPDPVWPMLLDDGKMALSWLKAQPGIDRQRIGAMGGSGGGWMSAMLGTQEFGDKVQCVVDQFGPSDFTDPVLQGMSFWTDRAFPKLFAAPLESARPLYRDASPVTHVTANDADFLLTRSVNDHLVPRSQMEILLAKLNDVGKTADFVEFQGTGGGHAIKVSPKEAERIWTIEQNFLDSCLKK